MPDKSRFPSDKKLQEAFPPVWNWCSKHGYPDPSRPVRSALMLALIRRLSFLAALAAIPWPGGSPPEEEDPSAPFLMEAQVAAKILAHADPPKQEVRETCKEVCDLLTWLRPPLNTREVNSVLGPALEILESRVEGDPDLLKLLHLVLRGEPQGHPSSEKRLMWVEVFERWQLSKSQKSLMQIIIDHGGCKKKPDMRKCRNSIRQGIRKLERFLKKYNIEPLMRSSPQRPRK